MEKPKKTKRGFANMDPEKQRAIASKGGKSVPNEKEAFRRTQTLQKRGHNLQL
jgi:general stress protein YciG